jgi:hypothetical protein
MRVPKDLPSEDRSNPDFDALLKKLGFMHVSEALQCDGEIILLRDQTLMEVKKHLMANADKMVNKTEEEIEEIITSIIQEHIDRFDDRTKAVMREYFPKKSNE